jgi:hypothetical protein
MTDAANGATYSAGRVYGLFQEHVISMLRRSPYWGRANLDGKFVFVLGGFTGQARYGREAATGSPSSRNLAIGVYNGGWDAGERTPRPVAPDLFNVLSHVNQSAIPIAEAHLKELGGANVAGRAPPRMVTYEAGPGYNLNGLNNARVTEIQDREQEEVMKSLAAGTATLDMFLAYAYRGFDFQNFFTFDSGTHWRSHAKWYRGGHAYPSWKMLSLFNNEATGDMLRTETLSVPAVDLKPLERRKAAANAPLTAVYATRTANRLCLFVLSRKVPGYPVPGDDGFTPVTVDLPFLHARSITVFRMTGDPGANNVLRDDVKVEKITIPAGRVRGKLVLDEQTGADKRGLPPASTLLYVFDDVGARE